jgi:glutathione S-transferase
LQILENALANQPWLAGKEISLAEFSLGSIVTRCLDFPCELPSLPKLKDWRERLKARPAFKKATA